MEIRNVKSQNTISIRMKTSIQKLPQEIGKAYGEIGQYMGELGIKCVGAPYAMYFNEDMSNLDVEIGMPVAEKHPDKNNIKSSEIPSGKAAVKLYVGPYSGLKNAYTEFIEWIKKEGLTTKDFCYEVYIDDPQSTPPEKLRTEIYFPLK